MPEKLKPCPFCGSWELKRQHIPGGISNVVCLNCWICGPGGKTMREALNLWNTRPEVDLICPDCNEKLVKMSYELEDGSGWIHGYLCGCKEECKEEVEEDIQTQTQV